MFTSASAFSSLTTAAAFAGPLLAILALRRNSTTRSDLYAEVDATDDRVDSVDGQADALFKGVKIAGARVDRLDRKFTILTRIVREHVTNGRLRLDALDKYVQDLPTFDHIRDHEVAAAANAAHGLRRLADHLEEAAGFVLTQDDLESGKVRFADPEMYELTGIKHPEAEDPHRCSPEPPDEAVELDDERNYDLGDPPILKYRGIEITVTDTSIDYAEIGDEDGHRRVSMTVAGFITPAAVLPCACDPAAAECSAECLVVPPAGVSESIIGTTATVAPPRLGQADIEALGRLFDGGTLSPAETAGVLAVCKIDRVTDLETGGPRLVEFIAMGQAGDGRMRVVDVFSDGSMKPRLVEFPAAPRCDDCTCGD